MLTSTNSGMQFFAQDIQILTWNDEGYPPRLKRSNSTTGLYVRGELLPEDHFAVAIVGTRRITSYGRQITEELSSFLGANVSQLSAALHEGWMQWHIVLL